MGIEPTYAPRATPLDPDEAVALIPRHIANQAQLNEWEHQNIVEGADWAWSRKHEDVLSTEFMRTLHKRMFGNSWRWAGALRTTEKNIGVAPEHIAVRLRELCDDARTQLEFRSYPIREIAARFHHRMVQIHPFANGNGRAARLTTDLLLSANGEEPFTWGEGDLVAAGDVRERYIAALRAADARNYAPLFGFLQIQGE
jgi:Fic-DOC domain mobile mystery protein B